MTPAAALALLPPPDDVLLNDLLAVSLTGVIFYTPVYNAAGEITDFTFAYLNPAAQRMMAMPERPTLTHKQQWPQSVAHGTFQFHVEAFESGEPRMYNVNYQADGYDNYYRLAARRSGHALLVSFTDTADQPRTAVEVALRESQATEKAARADAEQQRQRFHEVLMQLPAYVAVYHGPDHVYQFVNPPYQRLFPGRSFAGRPFRESMPEASGLGVVALFDRVYQTGEPYYAQEMEGWSDFQGTGQPEQVFLNLYLHPLRNAQGAIDGVLHFSYDVTEQVHSRQQLQQLNQELESRVAARTQEVEAARAEAEEQRNRLLRLFNQAPTHINLFAGPEHVLTLVHPATAELLPNRPLLGLPRRQALPELPEEQHGLLDEVYRTGQPRYVHERLSRLDLHSNGVLHDVYFDLTFQPLFDAAGQMEGVMSFAVNVTERVRIRRQAEALQAEMAAASQQQAREREAFFQVFEQTPALVQLLRTARHRIAYVNPAYQQVFAGRRLVGLALADALPELLEQGFGALLDHVYQTGETYFGLEVPVQLPVAGQAPRAAYFTFTYQAFHEDGEIAGISVFAYEVTEQVRARRQEEEGREELRRFKFMADQARDAFILMRQDGSFAYLNSQALAAWGYTEEEARHLRVPDVDMRYQALDFAQQFAETQHTPVATLLTQHRRRDGHVFPVEVSLTSLQLEGQPHLLAVARDVTAQQNANEALRESEARFRIMADAAPNQVWAVNPDSTIRYVNRAFLDFVGVSLEEYIHVGWASFMHPDELAGAQQALEAAIESRAPLYAGTPHAPPRRPVPLAAGPGRPQLLRQRGALRLRGLGHRHHRAQAHQRAADPYQRRPRQLYLHRLPRPQSAHYQHRGLT